jgi:hypothetical protein
MAEKPIGVTGFLMRLSGDRGLIHSITGQDSSLYEYGGLATTASALNEIQHHGCYGSWAP